MVANRLLQVEKIDKAEFEAIVSGTNGATEQSHSTEDGEGNHEQAGDD